MKGLSLLPIAEAPQKGSRADEDKVQPEGRVVLVRQTRVRAVGVEHLEQTVDEVLAVLRPFVAVDRQKALGSEHRASVLGRRAAGGSRMIHGERDGIEEAFEEGSQLGIGGRPITAGVRLDCSRSTATTGILRLFILSGIAMAGWRALAWRVRDTRSA
jgi:hypothetical protein